MSNPNRSTKCGWLADGVPDHAGLRINASPPGRRQLSPELGLCRDTAERREGKPFEDFLLGSWEELPLED